MFSLQSHLPSSSQSSVKDPCPSHLQARLKIKAFVILYNQSTYPGNIYFHKVGDLGKVDFGFQFYSWLNTFWFGFGYLLHRLPNIHSILTILQQIHYSLQIQYLGFKTSFWHFTIHTFVRQNDVQSSHFSILFLSVLESSFSIGIFSIGRHPEIGVLTLSIRHWKVKWKLAINWYRFGKGSIMANNHKESLK